MKKYWFLFLALYTIAWHTQAQYIVNDKDDVGTIRNSTLAIVQHTPDGKILKNLADKPEKLAEYKKLLEDFNNYLKQAITAEWKLSEVKFITGAEAEALKSKRDASVCLLEVYEQRSNELSNVGTSTVAYPPNRDGLIYLLDGDVGVPLLKISSAAKPKKVLASTFIPEMKVGTATMTWCVQQLINQLEDCESGVITGFKDWRKVREAKTPLLKTKTLLLCDEFLEEEFRKELKNNEVTNKDYPFPFELVSYDKLSEIVARHDDQYAYCLVTPNLYQASKRQQYDYIIVDAKDGRLLYWTGAGLPKNEFSSVHFTDAGKDASR